MKASTKAVLAIILMAAAIGLIARQFLGNASSSARPASTAIAAPTPAPALPAPAVVRPAAQQEQKPAPLQTVYEELLAKVSEKDLAYRNPSFKNPMAPLVSGAKKESAAQAEDGSNESVSKGYSIKGIIWNDKQPLALINDQVVGVGERLDDGALITDITSNSVKFTKRGNRFVLDIREEQ
jgi:hypothetical protein